MKKYFITLTTCLLLILVFTQKTLAQTQQTIRFGVDYFYPPFAYATNAGQNVYGFDVELARALCEQIQAICVFTPMSLQEMFISLDNNRVDAIISAISITTARKTKYDFAGPYFKSTMSYLGRTTDNFNINLQELRNKKIGVVRDSTFDIYLAQIYDGIIKIITYASIEDAIKELDDKKIDLVLLDTPVANYWTHNSSGKLKLFGYPQNKVLPHDQGYGIAVKGGNVQLAAQLDTALLTIMNNGVYDEIKKRYF